MSKEESSMIQENETPKYLKSTESDVSKSNRKSKHKHQYEECLIQYKQNFKSNVFTQEYLLKKKKNVFVHHYAVTVQFVEK